jgi:hypothetical protein
MVAQASLLGHQAPRDASGTRGVMKAMTDSGRVVIK